MAKTSIIQPCEICGRTDPPQKDDKYDDVYSPARPGSKAAALGLEKERLCGRCACAQFMGSYWDGDRTKHHTPIEQYILRGRTIFVKRDDQWNGGRYGGGNAKLRGAEIYLRSLQQRGVDHVAVLDSRTSRGGWGVAELCRDLRMGCDIYYGMRKAERGQPAPYHQQQAQKAGATLIEVPASRIYPMYYNARIDCHKRGVYLMPMGLQMSESLLSVQGEAQSLPKELKRGSIVCCVATGTMFTGMTMGLHGTKAEIIGVYIGMTSGELTGRVGSNPEAIVRRRIQGLMPDGFDSAPFDIRFAGVEYYGKDEFPCPFNSDPWYDRKAWHWLVDHLDELKDPVVFWNIG